MDAFAARRFAYAQGALLQAQLQTTYGHNRAARRAAHRPAAGLADEAIIKASTDMAQSLGHVGLGSAAAEGAVGGGGAEGAGGGDDWVGPVGHPFTPYTRFPARSDAWNTIMAWLHSRIPHTRG